jgi:hypothetical protein
MTLVAAVSSDKSAEPVKMTSNYSYPDLEEKERHDYGPVPDPESIVKTVSISSSNLAHEKVDGLKVWRFRIDEEGCRSARLNFKPFFMDRGDYIVVYGLDTDTNKTGVQRHDFKGWRDRGEVNTRRVWGKQLVLELHMSSAHSRFLLNYVHYSDCFQQAPLPPRSVCGENNWYNVACFTWRYPLPNIVSHAPSVFRLRFVKDGNSFLCTAWKADKQGRYLTNWHCLGSQDVTNTAELDYNYDSSLCYMDRGQASNVYNADTLIQTSGSVSLDFSIFTVQEDTSHVNCLTRTNTPPSPLQPMLIIHHPGGQLKKVSVFSDRDSQGYCQRSDTCSGRPNDYCYMCDTLGGSSGSPVFTYTSNGPMPVYALHHLGGCPNSGVKMSLVELAAGNNLGECP